MVGGSYTKQICSLSGRVNLGITGISFSFSVGSYIILLNRTSQAFR